MGNNEYKVIELKKLHDEGTIFNIQKLGNFLHYLSYVSKSLKYIKGVYRVYSLEIIDFRGEDSKIILEDFSRMIIYEITDYHYFLSIDRNHGDFIIDRTIKIPMDLWKEYEEYRKEPNNE